MVVHAARMLALVAAAAITTSLLSAPAHAATTSAFAPGATVRATDLGATVTADLAVSPARYDPGTALTISITGTLTTVAQRDVACHSLDTRVLRGRLELRGSLDMTDRIVQREGESHTQAISVDVALTAPDWGNLTVKVALECSPVDETGDWSILGSTSAVIWTGRIVPGSSSLAISQEWVFPDAEGATSKARITARTRSGPITVTVAHRGRPVWSMTTPRSRLAATIPSAKLSRSGVYTVTMQGNPGRRATFRVSHGWAPLIDGTVAHWPRCSTITWTYDGRNAPRGGDARMGDDLSTAFGQLAKLTGLRFTEADGDSADITVNWTDAPSGGADAFGGASEFGGILGSGELTMFRDSNWAQTPGTGTRGRGALLLHEIGHILGLGHVTDRGQLMFPIHTLGKSPLTPQRGDIAGLKELYAPATCR
ncbi:MAG: matrixin family metalloprotease [Candidatus Nanopelagicales bacterium]|jgi:hypothetical protein